MSGYVVEGEKPNLRSNVPNNFLQGIKKINNAILKKKKYYIICDTFSATTIILV